MNPMNTIATTIIQLAIFLTPLFFLPITRDSVNFNKHMFLIACALVLVVAYLIRSMKQHRFVFISTPLDMPLILFAVAYLASLFISSPNIIFALTQPTGAGTIFALTLIFLFGRQFIASHDKVSVEHAQSVFITPLLYAAAVLSFLYLFQVTGVMAKLPVAPYLKDPLFSPTGSIFTFATFIAVCLILVVTKILDKNGRKQSVYNQTVLGILLIVGLIGSLYTLIQPGNRPRLLPQIAGWSIAAESLKEPRNALFGVSPGNYVNVFTKEKPTSLNSDPYWVIRYNTSSNYVFGILSETGIVGLAAFVYLVYHLLKFRLVSPAIIAILIGILLIPVNLVLLFVLYILLSARALQKHHVLQYPSGKDSFVTDILAHAFEGHDKKEREFGSRVVTVTSLAGILLAGTAVYFTARIYAAEVVMTQGIQSTQTSEHARTYDLQLKAIQLNPYHPDYRIIFSRTNLALANLIAGQETITDTQKQTVTQLITQSVNSAKTAVQLYPSAVTWENLADIYSNLINVAQGADSWTIAALNQALALDPSNPALRIRLGGIYYALGQYDAATRQFELAVQLKSNFANAWYNLANSLKKEGKLDLAALYYQQTLSLLDPSSADYQQAKAELDALIAESQGTQPQGPAPELEELSSPESTPSTNLDNTGIEVEEDAAPQYEVGPEETVNASESGDLLLPQE